MNEWQRDSLESTPEISEWICSARSLQLIYFAYFCSFPDDGVILLIEIHVFSGCGVGVCIYFFVLTFLRAWAGVTAVLIGTFLIDFVFVLSFVFFIWFDIEL